MKRALHHSRQTITRGKIPLALVVPLCLCLIVAALSAGTPFALDVAMSGLSVDATEHDVWVSFTIEGAFNDEIREKIDTGLPVTFQYELELARRRTFWFDKTLVRKTVTTMVTYDTLTRQYSLAKKIDDEIAETSVAVDELDMMRWMTQMDRIRLADPAAFREDDGNLYVRVKSKLQRRFILLFIPSSFGTSWEKVGLNLPAEGTGRAR